jgi:hypothetical protein
LGEKYYVDTILQGCSNWRKSLLKRKKKGFDENSGGTE